MVSTANNNNQCHGQSSTTITTGKKVLLAALTIASASSLIATTEAFQPPTMAASFGTTSSSSSRADSTKLKYAVSWDQATTAAKGIELKKPKKSTKSKTIKTETVVDNHGYIVANHDNERDFWLHALQNLEPATTSKSKNNHNGDDDDQSLWTRIACAYGPKEFREIRDRDSSSSSNSRIRKKDADLVRVGDTDLDITIAVPSDSNLESIENVVSSKEERSGNRLVTIRVDFPEGKSFDKDAFSFEDELSAVIGQVRLLEQTANDKLSKLEE